MPGLRAEGATSRDVRADCGTDQLRPADVIVLGALVQRTEQGVINADGDDARGSVAHRLAPTLAHLADVVSPLSLVGPLLDRLVRDWDTVDRFHDQSVLQNAGAEHRLVALAAAWNTDFTFGENYLYSVKGGPSARRRAGRAAWRPVPARRDQADHTAYQEAPDPTEPVLPLDRSAHHRRRPDAPLSRRLRAASRARCVTT